MGIEVLEFLTVRKPISADMFQALVIPSRDFPQAAMPQYRVFSDAKNFVTVEAENAQTALAKSGISNAARIEYYALLLKNVIAAIDMPVNAAAAPAAELSTDDVDKLLNT